MQVIGFTFTKISGEKKENFTSSVKNINLGFENITEEKIEMLKDEKAIKITFTYSVKYNEPRKERGKTFGRNINTWGNNPYIDKRRIKRNSKELGRQKNITRPSNSPLQYNLQKNNTQSSIFS